MSIPGIQAASPANPLTPLSGPRPDNANTQTSSLLFDRFQQSGTRPNMHVGPLTKLRLLATHPLLLTKLAKGKSKTGGAESAFARVKMYGDIKKALPANERAALPGLLKQGALLDTDEGHSTLYYFYSLLTTRRANGYDGRTLLREAVRLTAQPYHITQKFAPLSENAGRQILQVRNNPGLNRAGTLAPGKPIQWSDLNIDSSATCVSSSDMFDVADKTPAKLNRHFSEATSPMNAFFERARLDEISPDDPSKALDILNKNNIKYSMSGPGEVTVRVDIPDAARIRAIDSQKVLDAKQNPATAQSYQDVRGALETVYQSGLTFLATHTYDPAVDMRDADQPEGGSKGLTEPEAKLMGSIMKSSDPQKGGAIDSVVYQAVSGKANPAQGEESNSYLYGYTRPFAQTANDLLESLKLNKTIRIGITDTDETGAIVGGHEIRIVGAQKDPKNGELVFIVADSDDGVDSLVVRTARELIPRIHHAELPLPIARKAKQEIQARASQPQPQPIVPTQNDAATFTLMQQSPEPMTSEQFVQSLVDPAESDEQGAQQQPDPTQQQAAPGTPAQAQMPAAALPQGDPNALYAQQQAQTQAQAAASANGWGVPAGMPGQPQQPGSTAVPGQFQDPNQPGIDWVPVYEPPGAPGQAAQASGMPPAGTPGYAPMSTPQGAQPGASPWSMPAFTPGSYAAPGNPFQTMGAPGQAVGGDGAALNMPNSPSGSAPFMDPSATGADNPAGSPTASADLSGAMNPAAFQPAADPNAQQVPAA